MSAGPILSSRLCFPADSTLRGVQGFLLPSRDLNDSARAAREVPRPG